MSAEPWRWSGSVAVLGTGSVLPGAPVSTDALLERVVDRLPPPALRRARAAAARLGVRHRHSACDPARPEDGALPGCSNSELASAALVSALDQAGLKAEDLGFLIGHTTTPAQLLPGNIASVAGRIGYGGPFLELRQACTGFANALAIALGMLALNPARPIAIVGSETGSLHLDFSDPADDAQLVNLVQMGDGAGAIVLGAGAGLGRIEAAWAGASGLGAKTGIRLAAGTRRFEQDFHAIKEHGPLLFDLGWEELARAGYAGAESIIPHQASGHVGTALADRFGADSSRFFVNANEVGNTGSAAIWIAFDSLLRGTLPPGAGVGVLGAESAAYLHGGFCYRHG